MTGDSSYEAWTAFMTSRDPDVVLRDRYAHLSDTEQRMLQKAINP